MSADQWWLFAYGLLAMGVMTYIIVVAVPSMARDRFIIELGEMRDDLHAFEDIPMDHPGRVHLERMLSDLIKIGEPLGVVYAVTALVAGKRGLVPPMRRPRLDDLPAGDQLFLGSLERRMVAATMRATLLGGPFWLLGAVYWARLRPSLAAPVRVEPVNSHLAEIEDTAEEIVAYSLQQRLSLNLTGSFA